MEGCTTGWDMVLYCFCRRRAEDDDENWTDDDNKERGTAMTTAISFDPPKITQERPIKKKKEKQEK
jgi:hypothetical protein